MSEIIGERVARLEERVDVLDVDVAELCSARTDHANVLQKVVLMADYAKLEMDAMKASVIPEMSRTMKALADEVRGIRENISIKTNDWVWVKSSLGFVLQAITTIAVALILFKMGVK